jgi:hypothetical protein
MLSLPLVSGSSDSRQRFVLRLKRLTARAPEKVAHHDPLHGDSELEALLVSAAHRWGDAGTPPALAREGLMFELH